MGDCHGKSTTTGGSGRNNGGGGVRRGIETGNENVTQRYAQRIAAGVTRYETAKQQYAQKASAEAEVRSTTKTALNKMTKGKLTTFIRKAIVAVATSPAEVAARTLAFEETLAEQTKKALLSTATQLKGML